MQSLQATVVFQNHPFASSNFSSGAPIFFFYSSPLPSPLTEEEKMDTHPNPSRQTPLSVTLCRRQLLPIVAFHLHQVIDFIRSLCCMRCDYAILTIYYFRYMWHENHLFCGNELGFFAYNRPICTCALQIISLLLYIKPTHFFTYHLFFARSFILFSDF